MTIEKTFGSIRDFFADSLEAESETINKEFEGVVSSVYIYPPDDNCPKSSFIGIDVVFLNVSGENSDSLSLQIDLHEAQGISLNVSISWGHPSGHLVSKMFVDPVSFSEGSLKLVREKLPRMFNELRSEIRENPSGKL